jgi:hypothetical protein
VPGPYRGAHWARSRRDSSVVNIWSIFLIIGSFLIFWFALCIIGFFLKIKEEKEKMEEELMSEERYAANIRTYEIKKANCTHDGDGVPCNICYIKSVLATLAPPHILNLDNAKALEWNDSDTEALSQYMESQ